MIDALLAQAENGFASLSVNEAYKKVALAHLKEWLSREQYTEYAPQIEYLIINQHWDYLLDSFYQVIPFGTGGRRGEVGIGPNRINPVTIMSSAQGHAQYLLKQYGEEAKKRGVVLAYDVREFTGNKYFSSTIANPVNGLTSRQLAIISAEVYAANGIKVHLFESVRTTPELSFAIRYLGAVGGDVFSASHNPPAYNGKKVYDEFGGQLVPPHDETLVDEVTKHVAEVKHLDYEAAIASSMIMLIGAEVDRAYLDAASKVSLSDARDIKIVYTPLHGTGASSVLKVLTKLGFDVLEDPQTSNPSGKFENITFQIPNPEVVQSFETSLTYAKSQDADILISTDPDADRVGIMAKHGGDWMFMNGNEIATILAHYVATRLITPGKGVIVKTVVSTDIITRICERYNLDLVGDLLIGFKYVGDVMNKMETAGTIDNFLFGFEESHGYLAGNYARDKDAVSSAIWLAERAAELKAEGKTLIDELRAIYIEYGYYKNHLTQIRMLGGTGQENISKIQKTLRENPPKKLGEWHVERAVDYLTHEPIVSETDRSAKNLLIFNLIGRDGVDSAKITIRPSGTEPIIKIYIELAFNQISSEKELDEIMARSEASVRVIEKEVMMTMYQAIGVDFPERGFLLFWQLPLDDKLRYFEIEPQIAALRDIRSKNERSKKLDDLLAFLGANPTQKADDAFAAEYGQPILEYLELI